jgi:hypothetical protein
MGNKLTLFKNSKKYKVSDLYKYNLDLSINNECPVCYENLTKGILLKCRHSFCFYCIQRHCIKNLMTGKEILCPMCRNILTKNEIKYIYDDWVLIRLLYDNWRQDNISYIANLVNKKVIYKYINLENGNYIIIPLFKINNIYQQVIVRTAMFKNITSDDIYINELENTKSEYNELCNKINLCFTGEFIKYSDTRIFSKYIKNIFPSNENLVNGNLVNGNLINENFKKFIIKENEEVNTIDLKSGDVINTPIIKDNICKILFSSYFYGIGTKLYLINQVYSILYK